jgi:hypothetical protein
VINFCSDQCRAQLNKNEKKLDTWELIILDINRILRKNRSIQKGIIPVDQATICREFNYWDLILAVLPNKFSLKKAKPIISVISMDICFCLMIKYLLLTGNPT